MENSNASEKAPVNLLPVMIKVEQNLLKMTPCIDYFNNNFNGWSFDQLYIRIDSVVVCND